MAPWNPFVEVRLTDGAPMCPVVLKAPLNQCLPWLLSAVPTPVASCILPCVTPPAGCAAGGAAQMLWPQAGAHDASCAAGTLGAR